MGNVKMGRVGPPTAVRQLLEGGAISPLLNQEARGRVKTRGRQVPKEGSAVAILVSRGENPVLYEALLLPDLEHHGP